MTTKTLLEHRLVYFWSAQLWTLFVTSLCLMNGTNLPRVGIKGADKYVHFCFHFVFALLWFLYFFRKTNRLIYSVLLVFAFSFIFGIGIELSQAYFTSNRKADVLDVAANTTGALTALSFMLIYSTTKKQS
ncbi:MAG: VanZ family protein [Flavobacterium sp.]|nr:VanZ family protein [Flavobacterium sp.]